MHSTYSLLLALASVAALAAPPAIAQAPGNLKVRTAIEVEYETEIGRTYNLQGTVDFRQWTDIGDPVFGHGRNVRKVFSSEDGTSVRYGGFRLRLTDGPTNGLAPWSLAGLQIRMEDAPASQLVVYADATTGHDDLGEAPDPFTYEYARLGLDDARVSRRYGPDRRDSITYSFTAPGTGTWVREEYSLGALQRRDLGVFSVIASGAPVDPGSQPPDNSQPAPPAPPASLAGLTYYFHAGAFPDRFDFLSATAGKAQSGGSVVSGRHSDEATTPQAFTYTYEVVSGSNATLTVQFGYYGIGGDRHEYDLHFSDGSSGTFSRRIYRGGALYATDSGAFSPSPVIEPPAQPPTGTDPSAPPTSPLGFTYTMRSGDIPERLVFKTAASGVQFDDSAPSEFTFTYEFTPPGTASLVVRFKADKWDEYDLTFTGPAAGTFIRREYQNGSLKDNDAGPFKVAVTAP